MSIDMFPGQPRPVGEPLTLREIAALLVKHYDLHEGLYDIMVEYVIGMGKVGPESSPVPGAMIGVTRMSLSQSTKVGPNTVDAAKVNPPRPKRRKAAA